MPSATNSPVAQKLVSHAIRPPFLVPAVIGTVRRFPSHLLDFVSKGYKPVLSDRSDLYSTNTQSSSPTAPVL